MDLLKVLFQRRIQPLQARAHQMWQYERPDDQTRVHPEELGEEAVENMLGAITPARDNPRGSRQAFAGLVSFIPAVDRSPIHVESDT
ncbi:Aspartic proteinase nepenthesin-1 [Hordeum vulgare]|nr:Aspartic proteinase nepenthesin-1 [Hordeum vulgare]